MCSKGAEIGGRQNKKRKKEKKKKANLLHFVCVSEIWGNSLAFRVCAGRPAGCCCWSSGVLQHGFCLLSGSLSCSTVQLYSLELCVDLFACGGVCVCVCVSVLWMDEYVCMHACL